jgi:5-methylcytosine-specific restriction endonuclease McrA
VKKPVVCKLCGGSHYQTFCRLSRKPIKQKGKHALLWDKHRAAWMKAHEGEIKHCYLCGKYLPDEEVTLDHVKPRSSHPELVYDDTNLKPACWECNYRKGSKSGL